MIIIREDTTPLDVTIDYLEDILPYSMSVSICTAFEREYEQIIIDIDGLDNIQ